MLFAGPPEDDIDWADVSPTGAVKWLSRVWRLCADVGTVGVDGPAATGSSELRRGVHKLIADATTHNDARRFNVTIARLMELTSLLRKGVDAGGLTSGVVEDIAVIREGAEALARMLSIFAPFTAEEVWSMLGRPPSVSTVSWPTYDDALLVESSVICVVQVAGKLRDRLTVSPDIAEDELRALALASDGAMRALAGREVRTVIVRAPRLVNIVPLD
jgi:leucyl-tRNA synthetase